MTQLIEYYSNHAKGKPVFGVADEDQPAQLMRLLRYDAYSDIDKNIFYYIQSSKIQENIVDI